MRILITGGAGFIGQIVSKELLADDFNELILVDAIEPPVPPGAKYPQNAKVIKADLVESAASAVDRSLDAAILLHGIMSSGAEADFELGYCVNVDATRSLLNALATACPGIRVLYASSEALSYGCQKLICETFINDYTRRGLINGFLLRFPTVSVRPGKPSAAVTSFLSGIVREPLNGEVCTLPLKDRAWRHWMCSPKTLVYNVLVALRLPRDALAPHRRAINMPGFAVTVQDMLDALEEAGGKDKLAFVREEEAPELRTVLYSWADDFDNSLGLSLGMKQDTSFKNSVRDYMETLTEYMR
ncbi:putative nucleoside-diphosphate-sugar epimerase [Xylaria acuta]|nr:putative nucleoside-diphosphate-sugar epimerase [Xylaria acuta]